MTLTISRRGIILSLLAVIAVAGAAAGAYFIGRSSVDRGSIRRAGYNAGRSSGYAAGRGDGYQAGYADGEQQGKQEGRASGQQSGETQGQNDAFDGYIGGWNVGSWYVIKIGSGSDAGLSGKYGIPTRVGPMEFGRAYDICPDGSGNICTTTAPSTVTP